MRKYLLCVSHHGTSTARALFKIRRRKWQTRWTNWSMTENREDSTHDMRRLIPITAVGGAINLDDFWTNYTTSAALLAGLVLFKEGDYRRRPYAAGGSLISICTYANSRRCNLNFDCDNLFLSKWICRSFTEIECTAEG